MLSLHSKFTEIRNFTTLLTIPFYGPPAPAPLAENLLQHIKKFLFSFSVFSDSEKLDLID
jgi:hypothetical protein